MLKNHCLAQHIADASWTSFITKLEYKAEWYGKTILRIGRFEPSTKICNVCGYYNSSITLADREWKCPDCNTHHDRDINAAINIKKICSPRAELNRNIIVTVGTTDRACGLASVGKGNEAGSHEVFSFGVVHC